MLKLIAYDGSGSTGGAQFYHEETQKILQENKDATILFWDNQHRIISRDEMQKINSKRSGAGGTSSEQIALFIKNEQFHGELHIITDGQVDSGSVDKCGDILGLNWLFKSVTAYLIETGGVANMSVTCPFTRVSPHIVYLYESSKQHQKAISVIVSQEDIESLQQIKNIQTIEQYEKFSSAIEKCVVAHTMGTNGDMSLRDELLAMKKRLVSTQAQEQGASDSVKLLQLSLENNDVQKALQCARDITQQYYGLNESIDDVSWSGKISKLISMCEGALRNAFDQNNVNNAIKSDRIRRANVVVSAPIENLQESQLTATDATFVCPITLGYEDDPIVLLRDDNEPVLTGIDKDIVNNLIDCPLNALNYPDIVTKLVAKLDHPISLVAIKDAASANHPMENSPITGYKVNGGICLGCVEEHCRATTWSLMHAITGGKAVGNQDLWFAVIWQMLERGMLPHLADLAPKFKAQMLWRTRNHRTFISLTGLPELPTTLVSLGAAVWYVFSASALNLAPKQEPLRAHVPHVEALEALLNLTGYQMVPGVAKHLGRLRVLMHMLSWVKKPGQRHKLPELAASLSQAVVRICPENVCEQVKTREVHVPDFVCVDGPATSAQVTENMATLPALYRSLTPEEIVGLAALVDPSLSLGDVQLTFDFKPLELKARIEWGYGLSPVPRATICIHRITCRPLYIIGQRTWVECAEEIFGPVSAGMSMNERYGSFVAKYLKFPTKDEFLVFLFNREIQCGKHKTLPAMIIQFIDESFEDYNDIMKSVSAVEFNQRWQNSMKIETRKLLEKQK